MNNNAVSYAGIPYDDINWYEILGQPFGSGVNFNTIVLGDADNIVDIQGAMAVEGNYSSPRGFQLGYGRNHRMVGTGYSPNAVRLLVGKNVSVRGPLVVIGHVVGGGNFQVASGSTYMIGKDGSPSQAEELSNLYAVTGGSQYWKPTDKGTHYLISSYDRPRFIPANRINANLDQFFADARESLTFYHDCMSEMNPTGTVTDHFHQKILRGNDARQNVFEIDLRPNGVLNKEIKFEVPRDSSNIVIFRTGPHAHIQYGLMGSEAQVNHTLYVFADAEHIHMDVPAAIWGSIFAPRAIFHGHRTGGFVSGNAVLGGLNVDAASGFEFHWYPFAGGVTCEEVVPVLPTPTPVPTPIPETLPAQVECPECPTPEPCPIPEPCPTPEPCPIPEPCPTCPTCPTQEPCPTCPTCPTQEPCPTCPTCPTPEPCPTCPTCPTPEPCPTCPTCPTTEPCPTCPTCPTPEPCPTCPTCPTPEPCPTCPTCPTPEPCPPCPVCQSCPPCPPCPEPETRVEYVPYPVRVPMPCQGMRVKVRLRQEQKPCPAAVASECMVKPGVISGCIWGCNCQCQHKFEIRLYKCHNQKKVQLFCEVVDNYGCFEIDVPKDGTYLLTVCSVGVRKSSNCKPILSLKNVGVTSLMLDA